MNTKKYYLILILAVTGIIFFEGCNDTDVVEPYDRDAQFVIDSTAISNYITSKGWDASSLDTASSYVIYTVLDSGTGDSLEYDDIVSLNFIQRTIDNDSVYDTNIYSVAVANDVYDTVIAEDLEPLKFTFTASGWAGPSLFTSTDDPYDPLFREVVAKSMRGMKVGGHAVMILPSYRYLVRSTGVSDEIFAIEIFPVQVRKHLD